MLNFSDKPYQYFPAKPNNFVISILKLWNHYFHLPGKEHLIDDVEILNIETLKKLKNQTDSRLLFLPNHPTHSDPQIMLEFFRKTRINSLFMAAYDLFLQNRLKSSIMQRAGAFSVDREGSDKHSMKQTIRTLTEGKYALTIFPEGNVYLMNDRVTPFMEGALFLALKAQKNLGLDKPIFAVPLSIKVTYIDDASIAIKENIDFLFEKAKIKSGDTNYKSKLIHAGASILQDILGKRGYKIPQSPHAGVGQLLEQSAQVIINNLEDKMELSHVEKDLLIDRVRKIRRKIHQIRIDPEREIEHSVAAHWADEAMVAFKILSYTGNYLEEHPTIDRFAETTCKLFEDFYSKTQAPFTTRKAIINVNPPVNLSDYLNDFKNNSREAISTLTGNVENNVQNGLKEINQLNSSIGSNILL